MPKLLIEGEAALRGEVRVCGSKNSCLPILAATVLTDGECVIKNCPMITDADNMLNILEATGARVCRDKNTVSVNCRDVSISEMPKRFSKEIRSSIFMLGPVVSRFKKAKFTYPGGCDIGLRPIDLHLRGLRRLNIGIVEEHGEIICTTQRIVGADVSLDYPSVGATENIMMAAVKADGLTVIRNAAREPEIVELAHFLNLMGARVKGAGSSAIYVEGVDKLHGVEYTVKSDRIVSGTYIIAAAMNRGRVRVRGACAEMLRTLTDKLKEAGAVIEADGDDLSVRGPERLHELNLVETAPYPGFPTDLQAQLCAAASVADGTSVIVENVFENRFKHIGELNRMGANITIKNNVAIIRGVNRLYGAEVAATDLRAGAALVLAGLRASDTTVVDNAQLLDRGYEGFEKALSSLGARLRRVD